MKKNIKIALFWGILFITTSPFATWLFLKLNLSELTSIYPFFIVYFLIFLISFGIHIKTSMKNWSWTKTLSQNSFRKIAFISIVIGCGIWVSGCIIFADKISPINYNSPYGLPKQSAYPDNTFLRQIHFEFERGNSLGKCRVTGTLANSLLANLDMQLYYLQLTYVGYSGDSNYWNGVYSDGATLYSIGLFGEPQMIDSNSPIFPEVDGFGGTDYAHFMFYFYTNRYIGSDFDISDMEIELQWLSNSSNGEAVEGMYEDSSVIPTYNLQPVISLDSEYYNTQNTRIEVCTEYTSWYETTYDSITLNNYTYKARLYDLFSNDLIYEDSSFVNFSAYRSISIDTIKLINNSGENINFTLDERTTNYYNGSYMETVDLITMTNGTKSSSDYTKLDSNNDDTIDLECEHSLVEGSPYSMYVTSETLYVDGDAGLSGWGTVGAGGTEHWEWVDEYTGSTSIYLQALAGGLSEEFTIQDSSCANTSALIDNMTLYHYIWENDKNNNFIKGYVDWGTGYKPASGYNLAPPSSSTWGEEITAFLTTNKPSTISQFNAMKTKITSAVYSAPGDVRICGMKIVIGYHYITADSDNIYELDSTVDFDYSDIEEFIDDREDITGIDLNYRFYSNVSETITISAYDWTNAEWDILTATNPTSETAYQNTSLDFNYFQDLEDNRFFRVRIYGYSEVAGFESYFDVITLNITFTNRSDIYYTYSESFSMLITPYSYGLCNLSDDFTYSIFMYDIYGNELGNETFSFSDYYSLDYTPEQTRTNLIALSDQQSRYLDFFNYHCYINGSALYEQYFYREINSDWNISVYDRFNTYITSTVHTVDRDDNFVNIQITLHSLKIYNQQSAFAYFNLTRNPITTEYWSEWLAPNEITEFKLIAGNYRINLTEFEVGSCTNYDYTLASDDTLLISSANSLAGIMENIYNVNENLETQINYVSVNITNLNSDIGDQFNYVEIYLGNVNSTLNSTLYSMNTIIENINNNMTDLIFLSENSFININSTIETQSTYIENSFLYLNTTIDQVVVGIQNNLNYMQTTILSSITDIGTNILLMNTTINSSLFFLNNTIEQIGNNISQNFILLNNSIDMVNNNISDSRLAILNNLALVNNTISSLITGIETSVFLINNSLYTAITSLNTSLFLSNNTIMGNLTVMLGMNEYLTQLYQKTFFSDLINWTDVYRNATFIEDQINTWDFVNYYKTQALQIEFLYEGVTEYLIIDAQTTVSHILPSYNVNYRVKSLDSGEYLEGWDSLDNTTAKIEFGFYEGDLSLEDIEVEYNEFLALIFTGLGLVGVVFILFAFAKKRLSEQSKNKTSYQDRVGERNNYDLYALRRTATSR